VQWIDEVLTLALASQPVHLQESDAKLATEVALADKTADKAISLNDELKH
jgi:hypothetical protein